MVGDHEIEILSIARGLRGGELAVHQIDQAADYLAPVLHGRPRRRPGSTHSGPPPAPGGARRSEVACPSSCKSHEIRSMRPGSYAFLMQVPDPRGQLSVL